MIVRVAVFDGADELDVVGPYEVFKRAARLSGGAAVALVSASAQEEVVARHGLRLHTGGVLGAPANLLVVPGGGWTVGAAAGVRAEIGRGVLPRKIAELHAQGTIVAGVCTGAMLLAAAGLLAGRPATTHAAALDDLRAAGARVVAARVVDDGDVITCGGVTAGLDLALWMVRRFWGAAEAARVAVEIDYPHLSDAYAG